MFGDSENYSEYIQENDSSFFNYFNKLVGEANTQDKLYALNEKLYRSFSEYLSSITNKQIMYATDENDIVGGENLADISLLFNQFMSVYTQLYKQDSHVSYNSELTDALVLLYSCCSDVLSTFDTDVIELVGKILSDKFSTYGVYDYLELLHYIIDTVSSEDSFDLILDYKQISELLRFVNYEYLELMYKKCKDLLHVNRNDDLSLTYELISDTIN